MKKQHQPEQPKRTKDPEPSPVQRLQADMQLVDARRGREHSRERAEADAEERYWRGRL